MSRYLEPLYLCNLPDALASPVVFALAALSKSTDKVKFSTEKFDNAFLEILKESVKFP